MRTDLLWTVSRFISCISGDLPTPLPDADLPVDRLYRVWPIHPSRQNGRVSAQSFLDADPTEVNSTRGRPLGGKSPSGDKIPRRQTPLWTYKLLSKHYIAPNFDKSECKNLHNRRHYLFVLCLQFEVETLLLMLHLED